MYGGRATFVIAMTGENGISFVTATYSDTASEMRSASDFALK